MTEFEQRPESLVERLRELADRRQKAAARERKMVAHGLLNAASGYRALADALERQPSLPWMKPRDVALRMSAARPASEAGGSSALARDAQPADGSERRAGSR